MVDGLETLASDARTVPIVGGMLLDISKAGGFLDELRLELAQCGPDQRLLDPRRI